MLKQSALPNWMLVVQIIVINKIHQLRQLVFMSSIYETPAE
jgi:hypothetical protein